MRLPAWLTRRRRKHLISQRREYCQGFFADIEDRFHNILTGNIPYNINPANRVYMEQGTPNTTSLSLDKATLLTNERVLLGTWDCGENTIGMNAELMAYTMAEEFGDYNDVWEFEYIPHGSGVDVFARYRADYCFEYAGNFFKVTECHSGSTKEYDIPFYMTDMKTREIKSMQPTAIIDYANTGAWRIVCTEEGKAKIFNLEDFMTHKNVWVVQLVNGKLEYKPALRFDSVRNRMWHDSRFITRAEVEELLRRMQGAGNGTKQIGTKGVQNPQRQSISNRGYTPNQQRQR